MPESIKIDEPPEAFCALAAQIADGVIASMNEVLPMHPDVSRAAHAAAFEASMTTIMNAPTLMVQIQDEPGVLEIWEQSKKALDENSEN